MSVPVHGSVNSRVVVSEPTKNTALPHNIYIGTPDVTTSIAPPKPLPNFLKTASSDRQADNSETHADVGLVRVPYPSAKIAEKTREAERASYAYYPGKKFRTKRVFKVIILGNAGVGKTCLSFRFCNGRFPVQTEATIGVDFRERSVVIDGELIRIQLWDTAGQERYRQSIVSHYYRNANAIVFVYDVSSPGSFQSLSSWITESCKHFASAKDIPRILIGNKCDLKTEKNSVKTDHAQMFADQNDMALFETSALADSEADHVESIFMTLVHKLQQSKPMHVQSNEERAKNEQKLLLKANDADGLKSDEGWCC